MDDQKQSPEEKADLIPAFSVYNFRELYNSEDYVFEIDRNYKVVSINGSSLKLFNKSKNEIIGGKIIKLGYPIISRAFD